jgi:hypothetical protein
MVSNTLLLDLSMKGRAIMAQRSTQIIFANLTNLTFQRGEIHLDHGIWTEGALPPETIPPVKRVHWESESQGFATGTEGHVRYKSPIGELYIYWDNPYVGSNDYRVEVPKGYKCDKVGGDGNNATYSITLYEAE